MFQQPRRPVLHLIACGAQPAADLEPFVKTCQRQGWDVWLIATPSALKHLDKDALAELTGHGVCVDHNRLDEPSALPPAGALAVVPASFKTVTKLAYGDCQTFALGLLNEAIGLGLPILAVPAPNEALARHPAFGESIARLRAWGVIVLFDAYGYPLAPQHGGGDAADLPWRTAEEVLCGWIRFARLPAPGAGSTYPAEAYRLTVESAEAYRPAVAMAQPVAD